MEKNNSRRSAIILVLMIIGLGISYFVYQQITSYQTLTINFSNNVDNPRLIISQVKNGDFDVGREYTNPGTKLKLKKGEYNIRFKTEDYKQTDTKVNLRNSAQKITINPSYSDQKLQELLAPQETEIRQTINNKFPQTRSNYIVQPGKLYLLGDWYATKIQIKQTAQEERENYIDIYRVVLKKTNNSWEVVTTPPEITLAAPKYPDIPKEILVDVNKNPEPDQL